MAPRGSLSARFGSVVVPVVMVLEEERRKRNRQMMMTSCTFFLLLVTREPPSVLYLRENNLREDIKVMIPARKQRSLMGSIIDKGIERVVGVREGETVDCE